MSEFMDRVLWFSITSNYKLQWINNSCSGFKMIMVIKSLKVQSNFTRW